MDELVTLKPLDMLDISLRIMDSNGRLLANLRQKLNIPKGTIAAGTTAALATSSEQSSSSRASNGSHRRPTSVVNTDRAVRFTNSGNMDSRSTKEIVDNYSYKVTDYKDRCFYDKESATGSDSPQALISRINCSLNRIAKFAENDNQVVEPVCARPAVPIRVVRTPWQAKEMHFAIDSDTDTLELFQPQQQQISSNKDRKVGEYAGDIKEEMDADEEDDDDKAMVICRQLSRKYVREIVAHTIGTVIDRQLEKYQILP